MKNRIKVLSWFVCLIVFNLIMYAFIVAGSVFYFPIKYLLVKPVLFLAKLFVKKK